MRAFGRILGVIALVFLGVCMAGLFILWGLAWPGGFSDRRLL